MTVSELQRERQSYRPKMPAVLEQKLHIVKGDATESVADQETVKRLFPHTYGMPTITFEEGEEADKRHEPLRIGVLLSGGQAPGGHNVIAGLFDGIKALHPDSRLYGFLMGPSGLIDHHYIELTSDIIDRYRNTGGFDMIGSGRTKLETKEQFDSGLEILRELGITALVIVGGDDSNTNACVLAEYYKSINAGVQVIGCPKTIDGDLKNEQIETSFGFDTATKVYSEIIGNIERDCNSARKYWHFIKVMGRSASHIALECALKTQPNICLISEEVEAKQQSLEEIVDYIAGVVAKRAEQGNNFGVALIPEGLIEFVPSMRTLIAELSDLLAREGDAFARTPKGEQLRFVTERLSPETARTFASLPETVAMQLAGERDPHGNVQVSLIETEKLISGMVAKRLSEMKAEGNYSGSFKTQHHFLGYEGRCAAPSNFDADYCYTLGYTASRLIEAGLTGYMSSVRNLTRPVSEWVAGGVPITMMFNIERRGGKDKPVIRKALVDLEGGPFREFAKHREAWALETDYLYPGPIQYWGPESVCDRPTRTIELEHC